MAVELRNLHVIVADLGELSLQVEVRSLDGHTHSVLSEQPDLLVAMVTSARNGVEDAARTATLKEPDPPPMTVKGAPY